MTRQHDRFMLGWRCVYAKIIDFMLEDTLSGLDLSRDEIGIYLSLLESGPTTAGQFSKKVGVPRATLYGILQRLTDKGVIKRSLRKGIRTFTASSPGIIQQLFRKKNSGN
jgi:sugar-specific transcriptional regulator TrmB